MPMERFYSSRLRFLMSLSDAQREAYQAMDEAIYNLAVVGGNLHPGEMVGNWVVVAFVPTVDQEDELEHRYNYVMYSTNDAQPSHITAGLLHTGMEIVNSAGMEGRES